MKQVRLVVAVLPLLAATLTAVTPAGAAPATVTCDEAVTAARRYRVEHGAEILAGFAELLRMPNVATDVAATRRNAEWIRAAFAARGFAVEVLDLGDERRDAVPPLVVGRLDVPGARRTLGLYVHYDGQPVEGQAWTFDPWEPVLTTAALEAGGVRRPFPVLGEAIDPEWRIYGRSAGDDKAPIVALLAALDALAAAGLAPTSNLVLLMEGEEEQGSDHLGAYLERYRDRLAVDGWLICDGPIHQSGRPQLVFGVRGVVGLELTVYGAVRDLHSGHYGNWAPNPAETLARLLASFEDGDGKVLIDGFYDGTAPITTADRAALARIPDVDAALRRELGLVHTEAGDAPLLERLMLPSLNVRGLASGAVGAGAANVIPSSATASLEMRLAKGNDPTAMLDRVEAHLRRRGWHVTAETPDLATRLAHPKIVRMTRGTGYRAVRTALDDPFARQIAETADGVGEGDLILMPTLGGSLPLYLFEEVLKAPLVVVPIANHDDKQHGPDENLRLGNLGYGIDLFAALLTME